LTAKTKTDEALAEVIRHMEKPLLEAFLAGFGSITVKISVADATLQPLYLGTEKYFKVNTTKV